MIKYLTYDPWRGDLNNVRLNFENVAALAHVLDRTLVISSIHRIDAEEEAGHGEHHRPLHPAHFLNLRGVQSCRLDENVLDRLSTYRVPAFDPETMVITLCEPDADIPDFANGRRIGSIPKEAHEAQVIHFPPLLTPFYAQIYADLFTRERMIDYVEANMRHYPSTESTAARIVQFLGPFHAVAVRRGDFVRVRPQHNIPIDQIEAVVAERAPRGSVLVIATDEIDRQFFDPLVKSQRYRCLFASDLVAAVAPPGLTKWQLACIEQNVCAMAETFVGTRISTFSSYICRLRGYYDMADTEVRFTDRNHRYDRHPVKFTWQGCDGPIWGREYPEGWTTSAESEGAA